MSQNMMPLYIEFKAFAAVGGSFSEFWSDAEENRLLENISARSHLSVSNLMVLDPLLIMPQVKLPNERNFP